MQCENSRKIGTNPLSFNVLEALFFTKPTIGVHFPLITTGAPLYKDAHPQVGLTGCVSEPGINDPRLHIAAHSPKNFEPVPLDGP